MGPQKSGTKKLTIKRIKIEKAVPGKERIKELYFLCYWPLTFPGQHKLWAFHKKNYFI